jgi:pimeloyl-ACP methyl ester carboxylesterase
MKEVYIPTNGIRLYAVEKGEGPLVLLLHGFPEFWWSWHSQIEKIAEAGFKAVAIDLPGYGRSDKPDVRYDISFLSDCIAGIPRHYRQDRMAIAGHDWGGIIVWTFARLHPEMVAAVIGVNTPDIPRPPAPPVQLLRRMNPDQPIYIVQFQTPGAAEFFIEADIETFFRLMFLGPVTRRREVFTDEVISLYCEQFRPYGSLTPPLDYYRNLDRNWELTADIAGHKIEAPSLMIMAQNDPVLTPAMAEGMEDRVPNLTKVLIEDCGHWTQLEQPEKTSTAIIQFLRSLDRW